MVTVFYGETFLPYRQHVVPLRGRPCEEAFFLTEDAQLIILICMNTTTIDINVETKAKAQALAKKLGISLSELVEQSLKQLADTKTLEKTYRSEIPNAKTIKALKQSEADVKAGRVSPGFTNVKDALTWLDDPHATYANGDKVHD